jgi:hypothetical protein
MRRVIVVMPFVWACACGSSSAGTTTPADSGTRSDSASTVDGISNGRTPVNHRAAGAACPQQRGPGMLPSMCSYDAGPPPGCLKDADCIAGNNGRCMHPDLTPAVCVTACSYDECFTDSDCPSGQPCDCRASAAVSTANVCVMGSQCRVDADCGPGGYCSPSAGYGSFGCGTAYFCHTAGDTCDNDTDCDGSKCQYDSMTSHWRCGGSMCAPPP